MTWSDYLEDEALDNFFGNEAYSVPATLYLALSTTAPADDGTNVTEPVGNNYARLAVTNNATNFPAASGGSKSNGAAFTFNQASGSWGTITHFAIYDAVSGGNMLAAAALDTSRLIDAGETPIFQIGALTLTLD